MDIYNYMGYKHADLLKFARTKMSIKDTDEIKSVKKFNELSKPKQAVVRAEYKKYKAKLKSWGKLSEAEKKKAWMEYYKKVPPSKKKVVIVPDKVKGVIQQKQKNLTAYGKAADKGEPDTYSAKAAAKDWTIVTDNCWGVAYMKALNTPYASPFFSMFIYAPDYVTLLENFDEYMGIKPVAQKAVNKDDKFHGKSKYRRVISKYPVIIIEGSKGPVEIHFAHEKQSPQEAIRKWESRKSRMDMDKKDMFVKMDDRDKFTIELGNRFLALKEFPHKELFVSQKYKNSFKGPDSKNVTVTDYKNQGPIGTILEKKFPVE
jgi:uncharacterized protein (DUF1919 family)